MHESRCEVRLGVGSLFYEAMKREKRHRTFTKEISLLRVLGLYDSLIYLSRQTNQKVFKEWL